MPEDITGPEWDLVTQLRFLVDVEGISLQQLAEDRKTPCSPVTLRRIFSGQSLPSPDVLKMIASRCNGDMSELYDLFERAREAADDARAYAAAERAAAPDPGGYGPDPGGYGRPVRQDPEDYDAEFWAPMAPDEYGNTIVDRLLRRTDEGPPGYENPVRREREVRRDVRRESAKREAERREAMRPFLSRTRPTVIAAVLLASFAVGIILATITLGGSA